jgi:hypothetical protein
MKHQRPTIQPSKIRTIAFDCQLPVNQNTRVRRQNTRSWNAIDVNDTLSLRSNSVWACWAHTRQIGCWMEGCPLTSSVSLVKYCTCWSSSDTLRLDWDLVWFDWWEVDSVTRPAKQTIKN